MKKVIIMLTLLITFSGCNKENIDALEIYNHIEQSVLLEESNQDNEFLNELEEEEKKIFANIEKLMAEGKKEDIQKEANKALENITQRREFIETKTEKINQSKQEFEKAKVLIEKIKKESTQKVGKEVIALATERYNKYDPLLAEYTNGLGHDEALYTLFVKGDFNTEKLNAEAKALNENYSKVLTYVEEIQKITSTFNKKKTTFYEELGIEVSSKTE